jgi:hypothetical protein
MKDTDRSLATMLISRLSGTGTLKIGLNDGRSDKLG